MFDEDIYYDYDSIANDAEDLYEDEDHGSDDEYDYDYCNEREFDCYYHTLTNELID